MGDNCSSKVSVLIPTYNREQYLAECLDSVLAQTVKPYQVIVIDDGSDDNTQQLLETYGNSIRVIKKANGGKSTALNLGLQYVNGDYVWIFDDDDVALPISIESRLNCFWANPDIDFVYSSHFYGNDGIDNSIVPGKCQNIVIPGSDELFYTLMTGYFFTLQSVLIRTECFRKVGYFDERFYRGQDYDMLIRLAKDCVGAGINEPTFIFRRHDGVRGPKVDRHTENIRSKTFSKYDLLLAAKIRENTPLNEFLPLAQRQSELDESTRSLALLRRALVMSSKGALKEMMADLTEWCDRSPGFRLTDGEKKGCRRLVCNSRFVGALAEDYKIFADFLRNSAGTRYKRYLLQSLVRGFFWVIRSGDYLVSERITCLKALLHCVQYLLISVWPCSRLPT